VPLRTMQLRAVVLKSPVWMPLPLEFSRARDRSLPAHLTAPYREARIMKSRKGTHLNASTDPVPLTDNQPPLTRAWESCAPSRRQFLSALATVGAGTLIGAVSARDLAAEAPAVEKPHLIDVHHHFLAPAYLDALRAHSIPDPGLRMNWTPEKSIAEMDANGVATAIVSVTQPGIWYGDAQAARRLARTCNEYAAQMVRDYPGRFGFFAVVPLPDTEGTLQEVVYALDVLKADGIGLLSSYGDKWLGDPGFAPVFDELNRRKVVVYTHPNMPNCCKDLIPNLPGAIVEIPQDTTRAVVSLLFSGTFVRCRDIRFIFSHAGGTLPMLAGRIAGAPLPEEYMRKGAPLGIEYEFKRLYYDTASSANRPSMAALTSLVPISQILFGTDYPFVPSIGSPANGIKNVGFSAEDLRAVGRDNALALLPRIRAQAKNGIAYWIQCSSNFQA
jgi:predicted TIM-barrel fold metal-dependent hydrolase